jgi:hypothetical protein
MPKMLKTPNPPPKAGEERNDAERHHGAAFKTTAMAEIVLFPNGNEIPFLPGSETDHETKTRWLHLADDVLDGKPKRKKS